jgi:curved DNA-binding protein CbpA
VDPYAVLGVRPGSSESQVAAAYKELAKRWHPDRGAGDEGERRMAEINAAYDALRASDEGDARLAARVAGTARPGASRSRLGEGSTGQSECSCSQRLKSSVK